LASEKRSTHFDRLYAVHEALIPFFRDCGVEGGEAHARMLESSLRQMQPGSKLRASASKSLIAASRFELFRELFSSENRRYTDFDRTLLEARKIFEKEYPDFFAKQVAARDAAISRGKIRTRREYDLIREYVYELEGETEPPELLDKLYHMLDDYSAG
jgi:hypothetical protein